MRDYLVDTNVVSFFYDHSRPQHAAVANRIAALGDAHFFVSAITLGEIEFGYAANHNEQSAREAMLRFVEERFSVLDVTRTTAPVYGDLRSRLFERFVPQVAKDGSKRRGFAGIRPEQMVDPVTSQALGIQENDLWIAAQALEMNLILATGDKMAHIRDVAPELLVENWSVPTVVP